MSTIKKASPKPKAFISKKMAPKKKSIATKPKKSKMEKQPEQKKIPPVESKRCASIRNYDEPQFQCLMNTKNGEKYCPIHIVQEIKMDYVHVDEIENRLCPSTENKVIVNQILREISLKEETNKKILPIKSIDKKPITYHEQKASTVTTTHQENEDELEIKLLILVNDDEYCDVIPDLIGPVFFDITLSEDEQDPVTFDEIWTLKDGVKTPANVNKYYLFSYKDSNDKIRCLTIFTLYNMINENNLVHPITMEEIPPIDVERAKKLIEIYQTKLRLFNEDIEVTPELGLKSRLTKLFNQFHIHSIYLEEKWLLSISNTEHLYKIIKETERLVSNNLKSINPNLHGFKVFQKKNPNKSYHGKKKSKPVMEDTFELQEYIVGEWEKLIQAADNSQNQIPIWILASGLSFVVPEVKQKYPDLEIML